MAHNSTAQTNQAEILTEVTPLSDFDFFYMVDRTKDSFNFPVHKHTEFEINCVSNCAGARRVVGDNVEEIGDLDLCIVGHGIEHGWEQANCHSNNIREITIQFPWTSSAMRCCAATRCTASSNCWTTRPRA